MLYLCIYYIFILCYCQAKETRLSSHTQACGFYAAIYNNLLRFLAEQSVAKILVLAPVFTLQANYEESFRKRLGAP